MLHVNFKKWQCHIFMSFFPRHISDVEYKEIISDMTDISLYSFFPLSHVTQPDVTCRF